MSELTLVTGGNGFLALHIIQQLLTNNHPVRATLRDLHKAAGVRAALAGTPHLDALSFVQADLQQDADWPQAMQGVTHVMSVAAPVFVDGGDHADLVHTAEAGTLRILQAAEAAGVARVVMTANFGAVGFSNHSPRPTTEADWTEPSEPGLSPYELSKLLAEKAAWRFAASAHLDLATVAAGAMLGRPLDAHLSGSFGLVRQLLDGSTKAIPDVAFVISDVEDVAAAHVAALFTPAAAGQRFLATGAGSLSLPAIADLLRRERPALAGRLPRRILPGWLIRVAAPFSKTAREGQLFRSINHTVDNRRTREILDWAPRHSIEESVLAAVDALSFT